MLRIMLPGFAVTLTFTIASTFTVNIFIKIIRAVNIYINIAAPPTGTTPMSDTNTNRNSNPKTITRIRSIPAIWWIVRIAPSAINVGTSIGWHVNNLGVGRLYNNNFFINRNLLFFGAIQLTCSLGLGPKGLDHIHDGFLIIEKIITQPFRGVKILAH